MDAQRIALAETCLAGAYANTLTFPEIVARLMAGGFEGYLVDFRRHSTTYYLPDGESLTLENGAFAPHDVPAPVAAAFDAGAIAAQVRWAQANPPDYSYAAFCRAVTASGCAGYMVSFPGRRALYFGRTAETHVELFPR